MHAATAAPIVGVVIVNYLTPALTLSCIEHLRRVSDWPLDRLHVVVVDNGSDAGFPGDVTAHGPGVHYIASGKNVGFAAACNLGMARLRELGCDYIALLNNDAAPERGWLSPLVAAFDTAASVGAATPKVLLDGKFIEVAIEAPTTRVHAADRRDLGVQLCGARVGETEVTDAIELVRGFWGWEVDATTVGGSFAWTGQNGPRATALLPVPKGTDPTARVQVRLACGVRSVDAVIEANGTRSVVAVAREPAWYETTQVGTGKDVINNAGTLLLDDGASADRGFLELDEGQFDRSEEVFGWSAAAVVLSQQFLDSVGGFDPAYFMYYEDIDLSWRGRRLGWTYRYVPESVVRHAHSRTVGRSSLVQHLAARNRLLTLTKNGPASLAARAVLRHAEDLVAAVGHDVLGRALVGRRPTASHAASSARILAGYAMRLPRAIVARRQVRRRAVSTVTQSRK